MSHRNRTAAAYVAATVALGAAGVAEAEPRTFELNAPAAHSVYLAGEMTGWDKHKLAMTRGGDGTWRATVDLARGEWLYKYIVDGQWTADPGSPDHDADGHGGQHSFVFVGAGDWNDVAGVPRGRVETRMIDSRAWGKPLKVNVYLPPNLAPGEHPPVLWLLHGSGMDADQWLKTGKVNRYMDNLIHRGAIHPFVIVMPSSDDVPYTGKSEAFITRELPAWLTKTYGVVTERTSSAVAGMSMGGFGAFALPLRHPDLYGFSFALSGFFSDGFIATLPREGALPMSARILCGSDDALVGGNRRLARALKDGHQAFYYREDAGGHTWQYWSNRMVEMLTAVDESFTAAHTRAAPP